MDKKKIEERQIGFCESKVELRASEDGGVKRIVGEAIVFERESNPIYGEFIEVIKAGALNEADMSRVVARTNHNDGQLLGTSWAGTMRMNIHDGGLSYEVDVPDTVPGRDTETYISRGDIAGSSFAFVPDYDNDGVKWVDRSAQGLLDLREIYKIKAIYDVSPVINPAYPSASAGLREHQEFRKELEQKTQREIDEERENKANSDTLLAIHKHKLISQ